MAGPAVRSPSGEQSRPAAEVQSESAPRTQGLPAAPCPPPAISAARQCRTPGPARSVQPRGPTARRGYPDHAIGTGGGQPPCSCKCPWHETAVVGPSRLISQRSFRGTPIATRPSRHTRRCNQPRPLIGISCMSAHRLACTHQAGLCPPSPGQRSLGGRTAPPSARISREVSPEVLPYARSGPHRYGHGPR